MEALRLVPALHRATHRVGMFLQHRVPNVSQGEAHLLAHLHEHAGEATVADLHRAWAHRRSTLTDMLDRLERRGLVRRSPSTADRRSVLVRITARGARVAATVHDELAGLERALLARAGGARAARSFVTLAEELATLADAITRGDARRPRTRRSTP